MRYGNVYIEAFGYELPKNVVSSIELEERLAPVYQKLGLSYGRFELMTGIRERRYWDEDSPPSRSSIAAAEKAVANSGIPKEEFGCLLHSSVSRDYLEPATAFVVHDSLGLPAKALIFDISNACLGFANGIVTLANMIELGQVKAGIVVGSESSGRVVDVTIQELLEDTDMTRDKLKPCFATLTLGSGAVAAVLAHRSLSNSGHKLLGGAVRTASEHNGLCRIEADTSFFDVADTMIMRTDYEGVLKNGLALAAETWKDFKKELDWHGSDVDRIFCHQVSGVHGKLLFDILGLDESKSFHTVEYLGNVGSVSLPISAAIAIEEGRVTEGDKVVMLGGGSGLSSIMLGLRW